MISDDINIKIIRPTTKMIYMNQIVDQGPGHLEAYQQQWASQDHKQRFKDPGPKQILKVSKLYFVIFLNVRFPC